MSILFKFTPCSFNSAFVDQLINSSIYLSSIPHNHLGIIGPYAYWQQRRLTDVAALQETHKALSEQVDRLGRENNRLHDTVEDLTNTVDRLEDVEQALDVITQTQGQSIAAFEEQVSDNRDILNKMQSNLKANVLQNLLQVVIKSDQDENLQIEEHEIGEFSWKNLSQATRGSSDFYSCLHLLRRLDNKD